MNNGKNRFSLTCAASSRTIGRATTKCLSVLVCAILAAVFIANGQEIRRPSPVRDGKLLSAKLVKSFTAEQTAGLVSSNFTWPRQDISGLVATATAVNAYAISYVTRDANGWTATASGLVAMPSPASGVYPVVQYHHGTQFNNQDVPSNLAKSPEAFLSIALFAAHGYVTSLPDYLGQGAGKPPHPYLQSGSTATACADMLKAVAELCSQLKVRTNSQLFICGLSEGGYATMALQRRVEADSAAQPFRLTASGPIAGPYDVRNCWNFLSQANSPGACPLLLHIYMSYKTTYGFTDKLQDVFVAPYDWKAPGIDNGRRNGNQMYTLLPKTIQALMRGNFLAAVASGKHPLDQAMEGNNTYNFLPVTPTRLYHGLDDNLVPYSMSEMTCARMRLLGARDVEVVNVGAGFGHEASIIPSFLMAKKWFDSFVSK